MYVETFRQNVSTYCISVKKNTGKYALQPNQNIILRTGMPTHPANYEAVRTFFLTIQTHLFGLRRKIRYDIFVPIVANAGYKTDNWNHPLQ